MLLRVPIGPVNTGTQLRRTQRFPLKYYATGRRDSKQLPVRALRSGRDGERIMVGVSRRCSAVEAVSFRRKSRREGQTERATPFTGVILVSELVKTETIHR
jgi:hypothetical protein